MAKILITGSAGFIGGWLSPALRKVGHEVVGVDRVDGDLAVPGVFDSFVEKYRPDTVIHLAAKAGVLWCEENPVDALQNNAISTLFVAKACQKYNARLIFASSSEVYGDQLIGLEDGPVAPKTMYGIIKVMEEQLCRIYAPRGLLVLRISMPFGGYWETPTSIRKIRHRAAVVNFLWQALHGMPVPVHAGARRSLCWIEDAVRAVCMLIEQGCDGTWNVGRDDVYVPVRSIAELACELTGAPKSLIYEVPPPLERTMGKNLSMQKLRGIGWKPQVSLEDGMRRILEWVRTLPPPPSQ